MKETKETKEKMRGLFCQINSNNEMLIAFEDRLKKEIDKSQYKNFVVAEMFYEELIKNMNSIAIKNKNKSPLSAEERVLLKTPIDEYFENSISKYLNIQILHNYEPIKVTFNDFDKQVIIKSLLSEDDNGVSLSKNKPTKDLFINSENIKNNKLKFDDDQYIIINDKFVYFEFNGSIEQYEKSLISEVLTKSLVVVNQEPVFAGVVMSFDDKEEFKPYKDHGYFSDMMIKSGMAGLANDTINAFGEKLKSLSIYNQKENSVKNNVVKSKKVKNM